MNVAGKKILVMGAGRSGVAAAAFLAKREARVVLHDRKPVEKWSEEARSLKTESVGLLSGEIPMWLLDQIELVIISPGIPTKAIPVRYMERAGAEVLGETELAFRFLRGRVVAITGTNGKTTTTALIYELLKDAGLHAQVGGNIGTPLISLVEESRDDGWTVVEMSSFQLETTVEFRPSVAVVLNIMPDHLDRYESLTDYAAAKHRIFRNQMREDRAILNADDPVVSSWAHGLRASVTFFSSERELDKGFFLRGRDIIYRTQNADGETGETKILSRDEMSLRGRHNAQNVMAALAAGHACGASFDSMRDTVRRFQAVEHRIERVAEVGGVTFYNDSKATNVDATVKALEAFDDDDDSNDAAQSRVVLILGGRGKNAPYQPLAALIEKRVRALVTIGEDAERIENELRAHAPAIERAVDMRDAVRRAFHLAQTGDTVLLAPACASFDMFTSYEHRGRVFKQEVAELKSLD